MRGPSAAEVDAVIRCVLADLIGRDRAPQRHAPDADANVFAGRLLALRHVEAFAVGVREVKLAPGTVITPLARDAARKRGITLRTVSAAEVSPLRHAGEWGFAIEPADGLAIALRRSLLDDPAGWKEVAAEEIAGWVADSEVRGGVLVSNSPALAVWEAHQLHGVRAAAVTDAESVARAIRQLGASLIVIEPAGQSVHALRSLCSTFRRAGAPTPPPGLSDRLTRRSPAPGLNGHADRRGDRPGDAFTLAPQLAQRPLPDRPADDGSRLARWLARAR